MKRQKRVKICCCFSGGLASGESSDDGLNGCERMSSSVTSMRIFSGGRSGTEMEITNKSGSRR